VVEKHAISQLQAVLTVSVILAENLKISHFLAGAKFRQHALFQKIWTVFCGSESLTDGHMVCIRNFKQKGFCHGTCCSPFFAPY